MIYPVLRGGPDPEAAPAPILRALVLMLGTALFLAGVDGRSVASGAAAAIGVVIALLGLRGIVAPGTFRARRGAPAAAVCAFLLSLGFAAIDSYVPLMLTGVRGMSVFRAGLTITVGACTWALGSWWQSSVVGRRSYGSVVAVGAAFFLVGIGVAYLVLHGAPIPLIYLAWAAAGFGMGAAFPTIPLAVMAGADEGAEGRELAPTLLLDTLGIAIGAGLGGAAITIVTGGGRFADDGSVLRVRDRRRGDDHAGGAVASGRSRVTSSDPSCSGPRAPGISMNARALPAPRMPATINTASAPKAAASGPTTRNEIGAPRIVIIQSRDDTRPSSSLGTSVCIAVNQMTTSTRSPPRR